MTSKSNKYIQLITETYAKILRSSIDFKSYCNLTKNVGTQLNDRKSRFDKSDIIEQAIDVYSNNRLEWVDEIGYDFIDHINDLRIEMKYSSQCLFTSKKNIKKTINLKIKNSLGKNKGVDIKHPAHYYLIAQENSLAIISWTKMKKHLIPVSDGIEAKIPFKDVTVIFHPNEDVHGKKEINMNVKEEKMKLYKKLILECSQ